MEDDVGNSTGTPRDVGPPVRAALLYIVLSVALGLAWMIAFQHRSSTKLEADRAIASIGDLRTRVEYAKRAAAIAQVELDRAGKGATREQIRLATTVNLTYENLLQKLESREAEFEKLVPLLSRWWWWPSLVSIFVVGYAAMVPYILQSLSAEQGALVAARHDDGANVDGDVGEPTMQALWFESRQRLQTYHEIAFEQSKRAFLASLVAAVSGAAVILAALAILWLAGPGQDASMSAGVVGVGALGGAFAGYISKTFHMVMMRSSAQLQSFFLQPTGDSRALLAYVLADGEDAETRREIKVAAIQNSGVPNASQGGAVETL